MSLLDSIVFVHSDVGRGLLAARRLGASVDKEHIERSAMSFLARLSEAGEGGLVFPAFNYDYGRTRVFDVHNDAVQVGVLPEWIRRIGDFRRTEVPFFSFLFKHEFVLPRCEIINPFDSSSGFHVLVEKDATLLMFGTSLSSLTFIHYVEEMAGGPIYRYEKSFPGTIKFNGETRLSDFKMHVRPMGVHMDYDWKRLELELAAEGILKVLPDAFDIKWVKARAIVEFWGNKLVDDPFFLLDDKSRSYFTTVTHGGTDRVRLEDYENE